MADLRTFFDAYVELAGAVRQAAGDYYPGAVHSALELLPPEEDYLVGKVSDAAGRAHPAVMASGYHMQQFGQVFNPIVDWQRSFIGAGVGPDTVTSYTQQLVGMYERKAAEAHERERGITGLIARFIRFPTDVREAAGLSSRAGRTGAFVAGVAIQVVATLIAAGLLALVGYSISRLLY